MWFRRSFNHGREGWGVTQAGESAHQAARPKLLVVAVVPIRIVGDPVLHTATTPIPVGEDGSLPAELADLIRDLYETMDAANGVGLAANQIGVSQRVFVYDCPDSRAGQGAAAA